LRQQKDYRGSDLFEGILELVRRFRPLHLSLVGGEPLIRRRELDELSPRLQAHGVEVQLVTNAAHPIPAHWAGRHYLHIVVSVDGLQPEHDARRAPATYDRILERNSGHRVIIHSTVTKQMVIRRDYLKDFSLYWSRRPEVRKIWFSVYPRRFILDSRTAGLEGRPRRKPQQSSTARAKSPDAGHSAGVKASSARRIPVVIEVALLMGQR
jgi:hypothetical protein